MLCVSRITCSFSFFWNVFLELFTSAILLLNLAAFFVVLDLATLCTLIFYIELKTFCLTSKVREREEIPSLI